MRPLSIKPRAGRAELLRHAAHDGGDVAGGLLIRSQLGHRPQILELELGRALGAHAEERLVELRLDRSLRFDRDTAADRLPFGRDVPHDLAVLLDEVRVPLGVVDDHLDRAFVERDTEVGRRLRERGFGLRRRELPDMRELEQPLRVRLRLAREPRQLRQPRPDERDRQLPLHRAVQSRDQRLELDRAEELDLVEQEHDSRLPVLGGFAERDEQVGQVVAQVPAVGHPLDRVDVDAGADGAVGGDGDRERLQHTGGAPDLLGPRRLRCDLEERAADHAPHPRAEDLVLRDLGRDSDPAHGPRTALEGAEEDRLPDAAQAGDEHRLLRIAALQALEEDLEALELGVAPDESGRPGPRIRRKGVLARVQSRTLSNLSVNGKAR